MAKGFKHGAGGGTSLNFKVVGGTSAPSNPKENMIWVNTDTEITSWQFGAEYKGKNLLKNTAKSQTINGVTFTVNDDGSLHGYGTPEKSYVGIVYENVNLPKGKYVITGGQNESGKFYLQIAITRDGTTRYYTNRAFEVTGNESFIEIGTTTGTYKEPIDYTIYPMIRLASETDDTYVPYGGAENGAVWISTGTSSTAPFNALKKNGITVYPMSAKQYVNGAWVNKTAKTYQNGKWVDWVVYVVPSNTFSWFSNNTVRGNVTKNNDNSVTVNCTSTNYYVMAFTNETFDLTGFNKMIVTYTSTSGYTMAAIGVATSTTGTEAYNEYIAYTKVNKTSTPVTASINISNINRPVYFGATEFNGSITIKEIRLEV